MESLQLLQSKNVLLIGDACKDVYHYGKCSRISPEAPVPVFVESHCEQYGGMALNVRNNLQAFNLNVTVLAPTTLIEKHRFVDSNFNQHLLRVDLNEHVEVAAVKISDLPATKFNCIIISDYNKGFVTDDFLYDISQYCLHQNIPLFVDSKKSKLSMLEGAIIKVNEKESRDLTAMPKHCDMIVTLGKNGAKYNHTVYKSEQVAVYDVCGAGDVFLASLVSDYLVSASLEQAIKFANRCAALSVSKFGTYTLTSEDIMACAQQDLKLAELMQ